MKKTLLAGALLLGALFATNSNEAEAGRFKVRYGGNGYCGGVSLSVGHLGWRQPCYRPPVCYPRPVYPRFPQPCYPLPVYPRPCYPWYR